MSASRCTHWLDLHGTTFGCYLPLGHGGKHVAYEHGEGFGDRPLGGKARNVGVRIEWDR